MEWAWARGTNKYSGTPNGLDLQGLGTDVLANYSLTNMPKDPAEDDSRDLPLEGMTATAGSEQATTGSEGIGIRCTGSDYRYDLAQQMER